MELDPLRAYEEAHEGLVAGRIPKMPPSTGPRLVSPLQGFRGAAALGPYVEAEAALVAELGWAIGVHRGDPSHRDAMRERFGRACQDLAIELTHFASTLTFEHYDLPDRVRELFDAAPTSDPAEGSTE